MATIGIELCDAGLLAAAGAKGESPALVPAPPGGAADWPGFAWHDGQKLRFGRAAEDVWLVHPRRVAHNFLAKLTHEPAAVGGPGKPPSFSELAFHFLREYVQQLFAATGVPDKVVLAVPGAYLKDPATEEEKIGVLLGIARELKLPLAGIMDMACAALCDPRAPGFNPALPVVLVDIHLQGADLSLLVADERLERKGFLHLPHAGSAQLLKHLTNAMGNRFLRHTAFDILEDGRIEQTFFQQTKEFLLSGAAEYHFHINTAKRGYEMAAKHEQLAADAQPFVSALVKSLQAFVRGSGHAPELCTTALTERAACLPGLEARLRAEGFRRLLRLSAGAAACGAARAGLSRLPVPADIADVPVETAVPLADVRRAVASPWQAHLRKARLPEPRPAPTHAIIDGIGHLMGGNGRFTIGVPGTGADLELPEPFHAAENCVVPLLREGGRLWFVDGAAALPGTHDEPPPRTAVEAGDRLTIHCGSAALEVLFASCRPDAAPPA